MTLNHLSSTKPLFAIVTNSREIKERNQSGRCMLPKSKLPEGLYPFNVYAHRNEPAYDRYELPVKPVFGTLGRLEYHPGIIEGDPGFSRINSSLFKHFCQTGRG